MQKYQRQRCWIRLLMLLWNKNKTSRCQLAVRISFQFNWISFLSWRLVIMYVADRAVLWREHWNLFQINMFLKLAALVHAVTIAWIYTILHLKEKCNCRSAFSLYSCTKIPTMESMQMKLFLFYSILWWWMTLLHSKHQQTISGYCKWAGYAWAWVTEVFFLFPQTVVCWSATIEIKLSHFAQHPAGLKTPSTEWHPQPWLCTSFIHSMDNRMVWINSLISCYKWFVHGNRFTHIKVNANCFPLCQQSYLGTSFVKGFTSL